MSTSFEAVVLRFAPDPGSGESLNVGVAMVTTDGQLFTRSLTSVNRIVGAFPSLHAGTVRAALKDLEGVLLNVLGGHPLRITTLTHELRRAIPDADSAIQWSTPVEGTTSDPAATFARLYERYVERHVRPVAGRISRSDADVEARLVAAFDARGLTHRLEPRVLRSPNHGFTHRFERCWKNGVWNCVQPISLDLLEPNSIWDKVNGWVGNLEVVAPSKQDAKVLLYVGLPPASRTQAFEAAVDSMEALRERTQSSAEIYHEEDAEKLAARAEQDLRAER